MTVRLALTLHQPWADLVVSGTKPIENRGWAPSPARCPPGTWIAIHAGLHYDVEGEHAAAGILSQQHYKFRRPQRGTNPDYMGAVVGLARFAGTTKSSTSPWFFGPVGWLFDRAFPIQPIRCTGRQGLWNLPPHLQQDILAGLPQNLT